MFKNPIFKMEIGLCDEAMQRIARLCDTSQYNLASLSHTRRAKQFTRRVRWRFASLQQTERGPLQLLQEINPAATVRKVPGGAFRQTVEHISHHSPG